MALLLVLYTLPAVSLAEEGQVPDTPLGEIETVQPEEPEAQPPENSDETEAEAPPPTDPPASTGTPEALPATNPTEPILPADPATPAPEAEPTAQGTPELPPEPPTLYRVEYLVDGISILSCELESGEALSTPVLPVVPPDRVFVHWYLEGGPEEIPFDLAAPILGDTTLIAYHEALTLETARAWRTPPDCAIRS
ncbi:hypothetical protein LJC74_03290 [Eubacteriales bacterium OttesenSCG-928-A19]|nr:hypothetical protein [Eubacteriales bacterium OttesenSCG-928-A19]